MRTYDRYGREVKINQPSEAKSFTKEGKNFFVISPATHRTWKENFSGAVEHATKLISNGNAEEFLIVKVVGRVKRKPPVVPVDVETFE